VFWKPTVMNWMERVNPYCYSSGWFSYVYVKYVPTSHETDSAVTKRSPVIALAVWVLEAWRSDYVIHWRILKQRIEVCMHKPLCWLPL